MADLVVLACNGRMVKSWHDEAEVRIDKNQPNPAVPSLSSARFPITRYTSGLASVRNEATPNPDSALHLCVSSRITQSKHGNKGSTYKIITCGFVSLFYYPLNQSFSPCAE